MYSPMNHLTIFPPCKETQSLRTGILSKLNRTLSVFWYCVLSKILYSCNLTNDFCCSLDDHYRTVINKFRYKNLLLAYWRLFKRLEANCCRVSLSKIKTGSSSSVLKIFPFIKIQKVASLHQKLLPFSK